jgi:hypothetical protein
MKIAIHQPQYLPWIPYFLKIRECDYFVFLDTVDFQKNGLHNRNKIKTAQGELWLTVPVKQGLGQKIKDISIDNIKNWERKHWQTIIHSYSKALAFKTYKDELEEFYSKQWNGLSQMNMELSTIIMRWLKIDTPIIRSSELDVNGTASDLILDICKKTEATEYLSGIGGKNYLVQTDFNEFNISIEYQNVISPLGYPQCHPKTGFINNLSALDIILNCGDDWDDYLVKNA